ncbi:MAG: hypothetical protein WCW84_07500 [Sulfurimonas sp.]|jgi:hypothetical protein
MTYKVEVKNPCRCFMRDGEIEQQQFATHSDAEQEAERLLAQMEKNYCKKHQFILTQLAGNYTITIAPRG